MAEELPYDPKTTVELTHERTFCSRHGEPLRGQWPKGLGLFVVRLFQECAKSEEWIESMGQHGDDPVKAAVIFDTIPMCCRVPKVVLEKIYLEIDIGKMGICVVCHNHRMGVPCRQALNKAMTKIKENQHFCFRCIVYR